MNNLLDKKLANGYTLNLGNIIEKSFETYKKTFLISALGILVAGIIALLLYGSLLGVIYGFSDLTNTFIQLGENKGNLNLIIGLGLFTTLTSALGAPFTAGLINLNHLAKKGLSFDFSNIFEFYNSRFMKDIFIAYLLIGLTNAVVGAILTLLNLEFLTSVVQGLIGVFATFTIPLIIYQNQNYGEAISKSITLFTKQPVFIIIAIIVGVIFGLLGLIGLCIGVFFTFPYLYSIYYNIYNEAIGFENKSIIDEIGVSDNE